MFDVALGQKQTFAVQNVMSALPPIADMCGATRHVRFGRGHSVFTDQGAQPKSKRLQSASLANVTAA